MKEWLCWMSSIFAGVLLALAAFAGFVYWRLWTWYNSPLGEPMHPAALALQPDYAWFWAVLFAVIIALAIWGCVSLHRLANKKQT